MLKDAILARLASLGIEVRELRFRVGPIDPPERPAERRVARKVPPEAALPTQLTREIAQIQDEELRAMVAASARANLAWQDFTREPARDANEGPRGARVPRDAETRSAPQGRSSGETGGGRPRRSGDD